MRLLAALITALACTPATQAQLLRDADEVEGVRDVGLVQARGEQVNLDLTFQDAANKERPLRDLFSDDLPLILVLAYFDCPIICPLTIDNLQRAMNGIRDMRAGEDYRVLILSFDHRDTPRSANVRKAAFLAGLPYAPENNGLSIWTGSIESTKELAQQVGFFYRYLPEVGEYSHPSALVFLSPDGTVHNYIPGIEYQPVQVRRAIVEAARGDDPTLIEQFAILCFANRDVDGNLIVSPFRIMQSVGVLSIISVAGFISYLVISNKLKPRAKPI